MYSQSYENMQNINLNFYDDEVEDEFSNEINDNLSQNQDFVMNLFSEPQLKSIAQPTAFKTDDIHEKNKKQEKISTNLQICEKNIQVSILTIFRHSQAQSKINLKIVNLNKFLKIKTISHLNMLKRGRLLTEEENQAFSSYQKVRISQQNNQKFFNIGSIKTKCYKFYHSALIIKDLFQSKANFQRKIMILKALQRRVIKKNEQRMQLHLQQKFNSKQQILNNSQYIERRKIN